MKILLLRPNSEVPSAAPPQGLLSLAAYVRKYGDHQIEIFDGRGRESRPSEIAQAIKTAKPDLVGITSFSMEYKEAHQCAAMAKEIFPRSPVVMGGPYPTSQHQDALQDSNIDAVVIGEGEKTGLLLFNALEKGEKLDDIPGLAFRRNGNLVQNPPVEYIVDLDEIPFPAWELLDLELYFTHRGKKRKTMNQHQLKTRVLQISTSRGCPYHCAYCHNLFGKQIRKRSVENVIEELKLLKSKYAVEEMEIIDDIFNLDLERAKEIFRRVTEEKLDLKFSFPNGLRSDRLDEEFLDVMKQAGVYRIVFAIESGSPRIQKLIKKNVKLDVAQKNIELAEKRGFSLGGFFMLGFPTETEEEVRNTIDFALNSKLATATFFMVTPFPGTDIHNMALQLGYDLPKEYEHYQKVSLNVSNVPTPTLETLRSRAMRKFYLNPRRIWRYVRTTPWRYRFFEKIYIFIMVTLFKYEK